MPKSKIETELLLKENIENKLVSVIVPVYNVYEHIDGCIESILSQSYKNFELILVDDGTPDGSAEKCEEYALKDDRIIVVHKPNAGQGNARNIGIDIADGEFVAFVDSDDYIHKDYIKVMLCLHSATGADIIQTKINITMNKKEDIEKLPKAVSYLVKNSKEAINRFDLKVAPYAKLYCRHILSDVRFSNWKVNEDDATYYRFAYKARKICLADIFLYQYFQSENSVMRNNQKDFPIDFISIYEERINYFKKRGEKTLVGGSYFRFCIILMLNYIGYIKNDTNEGDRERVLRLFRENYKHCRLKGGPVLYKILMRAFYINPYFTTKMMLMLHLR